MMEESEAGREEQFAVEVAKEADESVSQINPTEETNIAEKLEASSASKELTEEEAQEKIEALCWDIAVKTMDDDFQEDQYTAEELDLVVEQHGLIDTYMRTLMLVDTDCPYSDGGKLTLVGRKLVCPKCLTKSMSPSGYKDRLERLGVLVALFSKKAKAGKPTKITGLQLLELLPQELRLLDFAKENQKINDGKSSRSNMQKRLIKTYYAASLLMEQCNEAKEAVDVEAV